MKTNQNLCFNELLLRFPLVVFMKAVYVCIEEEISNGINFYHDYRQSLELERKKNEIEAFCLQNSRGFRDKLAQI